MTKQQERKQHIRAFMQAHYTDERLAQLLAHAQDGKLSYSSCCCFIGVVTADHALRGLMTYDELAEQKHFTEARIAAMGSGAESAFAHLSWRGNESENNAVRRRILIPMIRAEMKRRANALHPETGPVSADKTPAEAKA